jgi:hypothetical protein
MIDVKKLPVQTRLTQEELDLLDQVAAGARQRISGLEMSRAEALRLAAVRGARVLLDEWRTPQQPAAPASPAVDQIAPDPIVQLARRQEAEEEALSMTPLQQVALAGVPPKVVEEAAAVPVPELENSVDLGGAGFDTTRFTLGKLCKGRHEYTDTGKTLLRLPGRTCPQCESERRKQQRARKRTVRT